MLSLRFRPFEFGIFPSGHNGTNSWHCPLKLKNSSERVSPIKRVTVILNQKVYGFTCSECETLLFGFQVVVPEKIFSRVYFFTSFAFSCFDQLTRCAVSPPGPALLYSA